MPGGVAGVPPKKMEAPYADAIQALEQVKPLLLIYLGRAR